MTDNTPTPKLDVVGIVVTDMARSLAFYRQLGLDIPADADAQPHVDVELGGGMHVAFDTVDTIKSFDPEYVPPSGSRIGLAFSLPTPADVDRTYARLVADGAEGHKEPWDAFWGMRYALLRDPDGNPVDLYAPS